MIKTHIHNWSPISENRMCGIAVRSKPGQIPAVQRPIQITNPPRHRWSGCWPGLEPNHTEPSINTQTTAQLPGPVANTKYCAMNQCNTMILTTRADDVVTVNFNTVFNLMEFYPKIEWVARDLVPQYHQDLESNAVYTVPPNYVESLHGHSNRALPHMLLYMHAEEINTTFIMSNVDIGVCLLKALNVTRLWPYELIHIMLIVRTYTTLGIRDIPTFNRWKMHFYTSCQKRFLSRREFCTLHTPTSERHHPIIAGQCFPCTYHSMPDIHPVHYTVIVNIYSDLKTGYILS
jgi:hypothetical protein